VEHRVAARPDRLFGAQSGGGFGCGGPGDRAYRLIDTRANGQPAFGVYVRDPATGVFHANGMLVVTLAGDRIRAMTSFDNSVIAKFGLPRRLPQADGFSARC